MYVSCESETGVERVSHQGVWVILVGRGNQGRGKSGNRVWGEMESNVRDVEKERGWSKGGIRRTQQ